MREEISLVPARAAMATATSGGVWEERARWQRMGVLPLSLSASAAVPGFRVRDLLALRAGTVLVTGMAVGEDVRVEVGASPLGWAEFEVVEQTLALRLVRLA